MLGNVLETWASKKDLKAYTEKAISHTLMGGWVGVSLVVSEASVHDHRSL